MRFFGCNFQCRGFSQVTKDRTQWLNEADTIDITHIKSMEELPVFKTGCDSEYSWNPRFLHLAHQAEVSEVCDRIIDTMRSKWNPDGLFRHPKSGEYIDLAFTGGESLLPRNQRAIVEILTEFKARGNCPKYVTCETNGTQALGEELINFLISFKTSSEYGGYIHDSQGTPKWFWSTSPKLSDSGEKWDQAIKPEILAEYAIHSNYGQFKYVVDGTDEVWEEVERATAAYRELGITWPVSIMPVGADSDEQEKIQAEIAEACFDRGYHFSPRVHVWIFGNRIGK